jgi:hypothetical protein
MKVETYISIIAVLINVSTVIVNIRNNRAAGPIVRITVQQSAGIRFIQGKRQAEATLIVTVNNTGRSPITVREAFIKDASRGSGRGLKGLLTPDSPHDVPVRIEGHDFAIWHIDLYKLRKDFSKSAAANKYTWHGIVFVEARLPTGTVQSLPHYVGTPEHPSIWIDAVRLVNSDAAASVTFARCAGPCHSRAISDGQARYRADNHGP